MAKAVFATSASPPTYGHADILVRASRQWEHVYWVLAENIRKNQVFSLEERIFMMKDYVKHYKLKNVTVESFKGAVVRYAEKKGATVLVRGLRNMSDFTFEYELAFGNSNLSSKIETICLFCRPEHSGTSSTLIRELALLDESLDKYVLPIVEKKIKKILLSTR